MRSVLLSDGINYAIEMSAIRKGARRVRIGLTLIYGLAILFPSASYAAKKEILCEGRNDDPRSGKNVVCPEVCPDFGHKLIIGHRR